MTAPRHILCTERKGILRGILDGSIRSGTRGRARDNFLTRAAELFRESGGEGGGAKRVRASLDHRGMQLTEMRGLNWGSLLRGLEPQNGETVSGVKNLPHLAAAAAP